MSTEHGLTVCLEHLASILRQPDPTLSEFRADSLGVKCCSHTLLLRAWVSVRRARADPELPVSQCHTVSVTRPPLARGRWHAAAVRSRSHDRTGRHNMQAHTAQSSLTQSQSSLFVRLSGTIPFIYRFYSDSITVHSIVYPLKLRR